MSDPIGDVLDSLEARRFWEQVYLAVLDQARSDADEIQGPVTWTECTAEIADQSMAEWKKRFGPKEKNAS